MKVTRKRIQLKKRLKPRTELLITQRFRSEADQDKAAKETNGLLP